MALLNCKGVIALGCGLSRNRVKQQRYRYRGVHCCILPEGICFRLCGMYHASYHVCAAHWYRYCGCY